METDVLNDIIQTIGILVGIVIAFLIYRLERRMSFRDKLAHRAKLQSEIEPLLREIKDGRRRKVELLNVKRYEIDYPNNNEGKEGHTYWGAELYRYGFNGIEFFSSVEELYLTDTGEYTLKKTKKKAKFNVLVAGVIPYEWIEYFDLDGDEFEGRPQFYVYFNGELRSDIAVKTYKVPYKAYHYYRSNEKYNKDTNPYTPEFLSISLV